MRGSRIPSREAGFTLVELLVGMAILSLTVTLMPGVIRLGLQAWSTSRDSSAIEMTAGILDLLENKIAQAMPLVEHGNAGEVRVVFHGKAQVLEFVAPAELAPAGPGLYRFRFTTGAEGSSTGAGLLLEMVQHHASVSSPDRIIVPDRYVLAGPGLAVRFGYFGQQPAAAAPDWHEAWLRTDSLPRLIEVTARSLASGSARRLVVAPRVEMRH